jgi:hypothetical protein
MAELGPHSARVWEVGQALLPQGQTFEGGPSAFYRGHEGPPKATGTTPWQRRLWALGNWAHLL